jgi:hypothetical protein
VNCHLFDALLDDHLDASLDAETEANMLVHAAACADCGALLSRERQLRRALLEVPVPAPAPGYPDRVLAAALAAHSSVEPPANSRRRAPGLGFWGTGGALAAGLALAVALWSTREPATAPTPVLPYILPVAHVPPPETRTVQPVRLLFRSATALEGVTIEIDLPDGAELRGYPGQQRLTWTSDLNAGANLLELPVVLRGPGGVLTATLNLGAERRRFAVQLVSTATSPSPSAGLRKVKPRSNA